MLMGNKIKDIWFVRLRNIPVMTLNTDTNVKTIIHLKRL